MGLQEVRLQEVRLLEVRLLEIGLLELRWRMAAQIVPDHVKSHGPRDKSRPAGVPNPPKVISSIQKAISVGSASPLFSVGTLFLRATIQRGCPVIFGGDCPATPAAPRGAVYTRSSIAVAKQRLEVRRSSEVPE